ncbi:hypothetical protein [Candidatus Villigracilis affinis]|uniref:hypothetical protein n=1 Tax=Candidatus Villigracilis affinis TaxID=3140682 RepID=UPI001DB52189|nr:hypothetical protein [Anaerolineales bacterium]
MHPTRSFDRRWFQRTKEISDWKEVVKKFYGVDQVFIVLWHDRTQHPWNIPMVLDPDGTPLPRRGVQTGRAGYFDLLAQTYWGGILTGDRITVHYDEECGCG